MKSIRLINLFSKQNDSCIESLNEGYCYNKFIFNSIGMPVDFLICKINSSFIKIIRKNEFRIINKKASEVLDEECRHKIIKALNQSRNKAVVQHINHVEINKRFYKIIIFVYDKTHFHLLFIDITSKKESNEIIKKYEMLYKNSAEIFLFTDSEHNIIEINQSGINTYGYKEKQLLNMKSYELRKDKSQNKMQEEINMALKNSSLYETIHIRNDGTCFPVEVRVQKMGNLDNILVNMIRDISDRKKYEEELFYLANHDYLTGLYNRCYTLNQMKLHMDNLNEKFAVAYIDVDNFKSFNDKYGHDMGDQVLKRISGFLLKNTQSSDIVGRIGGDEFIIYISRIKREKDVEYILNKIIDDLKKPINVGNIDIHIKISIGVAIFPDNSKQLQNLLIYADQAMYEAKKFNDNKYIFYDKIYLN